MFNSKRGIEIARKIAAYNRERELEEKMKFLELMDKVESEIIWLQTEKEIAEVRERGLGLPKYFYAHTFDPSKK